MNVGSIKKIVFEKWFSSGVTFDKKILSEEQVTNSDVFRRPRKKLLSLNNVVTAYKYEFLKCRSAERG